ncbi:MAG: CHAT domain-containing protein, partial [Bacteroidota bacterium]
ARAFQYAGSRQVLTTLWQTDDQAGATLTNNFFREVAAEQGTHIALQRARQKWLDEADPFKAHPFFWAGYVLIGDGAAIKQPNRISWIWILLGVVGVGGLGILGWRRLKGQAC